MCELDLLLLLEYFKVVVSWPVAAVLVVVLLVTKLKDPLSGLLARIIEANIFGQSIKLANQDHNQQMSGESLNESISRIEASKEGEVIPPELSGEPNIEEAIKIVRENPAATIVEYRKIFMKFNYEKFFNSIFGSQINLLLFVSKSPNNFFWVNEIELFYKEHMSKAGQFAISEDRFYLNLVDSGLMVYEVNKGYCVTLKGLEFVRYIQESYPQTWMFRAF